VKDSCSRSTYQHPLAAEGSTRAVHEPGFWKRETTPDGPRWVDARSSDDERAARWEAKR